MTSSNVYEGGDVRSIFCLPAKESDLRISNNIRKGVVILLLCGSATDFLSKVIYQLISAATVSDRKSEFSLTTAYVLAVLSFFSCAVPPIFYFETRECLRRLITRRFLLKVSAPSVFDLGVTGAKYAAIVFVSPSVVSIIKTSVQLITLAILNMFTQRKEHSRGQWIGILGVLMGNGLVFAASILTSESSSNTDKSDDFLGLTLSVFSGFFGAIRNMIEETLLQDDGMTNMSLLLVESVVSLIFALIVGVALMEITDHQMSSYWSKWTTAGVIPAVCMFVIFIYGRDFGKLKLMKYSSAIIAKIVSLVFPFGTWALSLLVYYSVTEGNEHAIGDGWHNPWSFLRLAGFILIVVSVFFFYISS